MVRRACLVAVCLLWSVSAFAQELSVRFYLVPRVGVGTSQNPFRPKYVKQDELIAGTSLQGRWSAMDYGTENVFLLGVDITPAEHAALSAQSDVLAFPNALDDNVSALALTAVQTNLEALKLPGSWVTTNHTYRQILRAVAKLIVVAQRYAGLHGVPLFEDGITLDSRWNQLSNAQQDRLRAVADSLELDRSGITATMTLRTILRQVADQLPGLTLRGEAF